MTLDERVDSICKWTNQGLRDAVKEAIQLAMRDQRHACAQAVQATENPFRQWICPRRKNGQRIASEQNPAREQENIYRGGFNRAKEVIHQAVMNAEVK